MMNKVENGKGVHPAAWKCPDCGKKHSKSHWQDYHQTQPDWKDQLGKIQKASDRGYEIVCEVCNGKLQLKQEIIKNAKKVCTTKGCKKKSLKDTYCPTHGTTLVWQKGKDFLYCAGCDAEREGIEAPLFCPHCGWGEERLVITIA